jgi:N-acetylglucosamine-6-phosphate deacetylase
LAKTWLLGKVVTPSGLIESGAVGIEGGSIVYAGPVTGAPRNPADPVRSVEGFITPGLIDLHLHGAGGFNLMDPSPDSVRGVSQTLVKHGVTSYLATSVVHRDIAANRHLAIAGDLAGLESGGAEVLGIHVEGPFVNPMRGGMVNSNKIWAPNPDDLKKILSVAGGKMKMMTMAPELPGGLDLIARMKEAGVIPSLGHTEADFDQTRSGFKAGIRHVTHLYNAMKGLHHRQPGTLGAALMQHGITAQLIADGVHVHPELLGWTARVLSPQAIVLISDALPASGLAEGLYEYDSRPYHSENGSAWFRPPGQTPILFGTTLLLDGLIRRAVQFMDLPFETVVPMATLNPARTLGIEKERGTLEKGLQADLALWSNDLQVTETILRGKTVWKK